MFRPSSCALGDFTLVSGRKLEASDPRTFLDFLLDRGPKGRQRRERDRVRVYVEIFEQSFGGTTVSGRRYGKGAHGARL